MCTDVYIKINEYVVFFIARRDDIFYTKKYTNY